MPHRRSKTPCKPGRHKYRGLEHAGGCIVDSSPHYCVRCRACVFRWVQLAMFDLRTYNVA